MKQWIKTTAVLFLALTMLISLTACGEEKKAEDAVHGMFAAFQALDFDKAKAFVNMDSIADPSAAEGGMMDPHLLMETLFDKLDYEILSSEKKDQNTVLVKTRITAVDMRTLVNTWLPELFQSMLDGVMAGDDPGSDAQTEQMMDSFIRIASQEDSPTSQRTTDIPVVKTQSGWRVEADEAFVDAVMGGLKEASEAINEAFTL